MKPKSSKLPRNEEESGKGKKKRGEGKEKVGGRN